MHRKYNKSETKNSLGNYIQLSFRLRYVIASKVKASSRFLCFATSDKINCSSTETKCIKAEEWRKLPHEIVLVTNPNFRSTKLIVNSNTYIKSSKIAILFTIFIERCQINREITKKDLLKVKCFEFPT